MKQTVIEVAKHSADAASVGGLVLVFADVLPTIVLVVTLIWTLMRMYESYVNIKLKRKKLKEDG